MSDQETKYAYAEIVVTKRYRVRVELINRDLLDIEPLRSWREGGRIKAEHKDPRVSFVDAPILEIPREPAK